MRYILLFFVILCACNDNLSRQEAAERLVHSHMERKMKNYEPMKTEIDTNRMKLEVDLKRLDRLHTMINIERVRLQKNDTAIQSREYDSLVHLDDSLKALNGKIVIDTSIAFWRITHTFKSTDLKGKPFVKKVKLLANKSLNRIIEDNDQDIFWY